MAGYSVTPLWKKLGYKSGIAAVVDGAPDGYRALLQLPDEVKVRWLAAPESGVPFVHIFCRELPILQRKLAQRRKQIATDGVIWVSWPKKASGEQTDITEDAVRACALPLGLVDIKVCAVDDVWSGLKLMIRKTERGPAWGAADGCARGGPEGFRNRLRAAMRPRQTRMNLAAGDQNGRR